VEHGSGLRSPTASGTAEVYGARSRAAVRAAVAAIPEGDTEHRYRGCRHRDGDPDKCHPREPVV